MQYRDPVGKKTVEVLEIEVQELTASLAEVESEMKDKVAALTAKYNEMREKDRKIISVFPPLDFSFA